MARLTDITALNPYEAALAAYGWSVVAVVAGTKRKATALMQNRLPVGCGPSSNT